MSRSQGQDLAYQAGEITGQAQTGEQMKNMAQGAAEAVKNTLGMNADNNPTSRGSGGTNNPSHPSNPSTRI
ncbi:hypothetical protein FEM48_Zijuj01G0302300 [Ziziphus jujuba var. spinosa]|uniref:Late embryogenesis abundant protein 2-like n=1 Tax=Ziziphus jujuba var. spinosa TaxID=714518 RepID=A0A978W5Y4_ZIZJJ|nr:hypothetical protein FEM48_Zijuj01G0302300 [Ziziphus jujuba var. spinosa]